MLYEHAPVMLKEVLEFFDPKPGQNYIDCTLGGANYTLAIAKKIKPGGKILSLDLDQLAIRAAQEKINSEKIPSKAPRPPSQAKRSDGDPPMAGGNIILVNENFKNLSKIVTQYFTKQQLNPKFNGIIFDLGLSSAQLQDKNRGFSFQPDTRLDMNFSQIDNDRAASTEYLVNNYGLDQLTRIFRQYGEEKFAKTIAKKIIISRQNSPIKTTGQLVDIIKNAVPKKYRNKNLHPATKIFQALRIATNNELANLGLALPQTLDLLAPHGKLAVISYHSLEDRIVKNFFRQESRDCICPPTYPACRCQHLARLKILTPHVLRPSEEEVLINARSRSAKLRVAEMIG